MVKLKNLSYSNFRKYIKDKKIYIFGAGRALESCLKDDFFEKDIDGIIDNDKNKWGKHFYHSDKYIEIMSLDCLVGKLKKCSKKQVLFFISSPFYASEIIKQLDSIAEFDGIECVVQIIMRNTYEEICPFEFSNAQPKIPKILNYIWIGGQDLPDEFKRNIESWKKYNPDYDIKQWNENNYDFQKNIFLKRAMEEKAWGFASNYARLDIVYNNGGIYLDTDVEVVHNFDKLLNDRAFFNMGAVDRVNNGCGFGAEQHNVVVSEIMKKYEAYDITQDIRRPGHLYMHEVLRNFGFEIKNQYQRNEYGVLYPTEVMSPNTYFGFKDYYSDNTVSIHKESGLWKTDREKKGIEELSKLIKERLNF